MTITINLHDIVVPLTITALAFIGGFITAVLERNDSGFLAGLGTFLVFIGSACVTLTAWIVRGLMNFFK